MRLFYLIIFIFLFWSSNLINAQDMASKIEISQWDVGYNPAYYLDIDTIYGNPSIFVEALKPGESYLRTSKVKRPGNYIYPPNYDYEGANVPHRLRDTSRKLIFAYIKDELKKRYFTSRIVNYLAEYDKILNDSTRNEYYAQIKINDKYFVFSGWIGKFAVFSVCASFANPDEFVKSAHEFYNIPDLSPKDVVIENNGENYFYSLLDRQDMLWLNGYKITLLFGHNNPDTIRTNIIQFVKYYDKDFVP